MYVPFTYSGHLIIVHFNGRFLFSSLIKSAIKDYIRKRGNKRPSLLYVDESSVLVRESPRESPCNCQFVSGWNAEKRCCMFACVCVYVLGRAILRCVAHLASRLEPRLGRIDNPFNPKNITSSVVKKHIALQKLVFL